MTNDRGEVIAEAEVAWEQEMVALLKADQQEFRFVTRLKSNVIADHVTDNLVDPDSDIDRNQIVRLDEGKSRMHLIETKDTEGNQVLILTNDFKSNAEEFGD